MLRPRAQSQADRNMYHNFPPPPDEPVPVVPRELRAKRTVPSPRKAPTVRSGKGSIFGKASIPSVYWASDDPTPAPATAANNNDEFTFYREGTPPPMDEKAAAARRQRGLSLYDEERRARLAQRRRRCCGLRMRVFCALVVLLVVVVLGVGVGLGVGLGMGQKANQNQDDGSAAARTSTSATTLKPTRSRDPNETLQTAQAVPTATPSKVLTTITTSIGVTTNTNTNNSPSTTLATSTRTSSSSSSAAGSPTATSGATAVCPEANNTIYSVAGSDKKFLRVCGIDYTGDAEAIDMSNMLASTMGECMDICAKAAQCTGASWGSVTNDKGVVEQRCWLKRDMKKSHSSTDANWNFAVLM